MDTARPVAFIRGRWPHATSWPPLTTRCQTSVADAVPTWLPANGL